MTAPKPKGLPAYWESHPVEAEKARKLIGKLTLDTGERWEKTIAPWQRAAYESSLGLPGAPCGEKTLLECCGVVGAGKDPIIAAAVLAFLHFGPKGAQGLKQSVTRDKSMAVVKTIKDFMFREPAIAEGLEIQRDLVRCVPCECVPEEKENCRHRNSVVTCGSLDGASTAGVIYDIAWLNEVQEWPEPEGQEVYFHIFARRTKRKGRISCFTNAPFTAKGEWRRDRWEKARGADSSWHYIEVHVEDCPWITPEELEQQRKELPTARFNRWFKLMPSDGRGELVTKEEVERAFRRGDGLAAALAPSRPGRRFLGIDVGVKRDHYSLCMLCVTPDGAVYLEKMEAFVPPAGGEVSLTAAAVVVRHYCKVWGAEVWADQYQAKQLLQDLEADGCTVHAIDPTAVNTTGMAHAVMDLFRDNRIWIYADAGFTEIGDGTSTCLEQQLVDAEVKEGDRGVRIVSKRTKLGHGDQASAFAHAALGVARAGAHSTPVTYSAPEKERVDAARARLNHRVIRPHFGTYLGPRTPRTRRVAR